MSVGLGPLRIFSSFQITRSLRQGLYPGRGIEKSRSLIDAVCRPPPVFFHGKAVFGSWHESEEIKGGTNFYNLSHSALTSIIAMFNPHLLSATSFQDVLLRIAGSCKEDRSPRFTACSEALEIPQGSSWYQSPQLLDNGRHTCEDNTSSVLWVSKLSVLQPPLKIKIKLCMRTK